MEEQIDISLKAKLSALQSLIFQSNFRHMLAFLKDGHLAQVIKKLEYIRELDLSIEEDYENSDDRKIAVSIHFTIEDWFEVEAFRWLYEAILCSAKLHIYNDISCAPIFIIRMHGILTEGAKAEGANFENCKKISSVLTDKDKSYLDWFRQFESHLIPTGQFPDIRFVKEETKFAKSKAQTLLIDLPSKISFAKEIAAKVWKRCNEDDLKELAKLILENIKQEQDALNERDNSK